MCTISARRKNRVNVERGRESGVIAFARVGVDCCGRCASRRPLTSGPLLVLTPLTVSPRWGLRPPSLAASPRLALLLTPSPTLRDGPSSSPPARLSVLGLRLH